MPLPAPPSLSPGQTLGLIAGQGRLPFMVVDGARQAGLRVAAIGLAGHCDPALRELCDDYRDAAVLRLGGWARKLRGMGATCAVMVGRVEKSRRVQDPFRLFREAPDLTTAIVWYRRLRHDRRSPAILKAVADTLADGGVPLIDSTAYITDHLATPGVMTRREPTRDELADVRFGWSILRHTLALHIGQAIAVRERDVLAVEAIEGTDRMIERVAPLCPRGGWTLLKGAHPDHDRRADVPTIGESTIRKLAQAGARCAALGAGDVILIDKPRTLALADELGVAILGVPPDGPDAL